MKIIVYGMGIIGGSIAASLKRAGHVVFGKNRSNEPLDYALQNGMIDGVTESFKGADVVFLALPPSVTMSVLDKGEFSDGCIVADICGVKTNLEKTVLSRPRNYRYVGIHPMAGKATTGIRSASGTLFQGANLVITRNPSTDESAVETMKGLAKEMGFSRIVECSAVEHDRIIALTSQLAHIVSSAYISTPQADKVGGFTGGSFQDMTCVAPMDDVWAELFLLNREALVPEISRIVARLQEYEEAIESGDREKTLRLIRDGRTFFERICAADRGVFSEKD